MDEDVIELSKDELQKWIRKKVKRQLNSLDVLEKYSLLQSVLKRREEKATRLLKLCQSVAACEAIVKEQYSLLGWEYRDTDSDDDEKLKSRSNKPPIACVTSGTEASSLSAAEALLLKPKDKENLVDVGLKKKPVVVLMKLPVQKTHSLLPEAPDSHCSDDESLKSLSDTDCGPLWEPGEKSSDSDYSISKSNHRAKKRRKIDGRNENSPQKQSKRQASTKTDIQRNATAEPQASMKSDAEGDEMKPLTPQANSKTDAKSNNSSALQTSTQGNDKGNKAPDQSASVAVIKPPLSIKREELMVDMDVLAKWKSMNWKPGKIMEIIQKGENLRYKVCFNKGKIIVSGHHIALACSAKAEQLFIGCRVVVKCDNEKHWFSPGILAEVPTRKNRMRFLVFTDDHTPHYVGLPLLREVYKPKTDPLDDIPDGFHKDFLKDYLMSIPFPAQSSYRVGQKLNAEYKGVQQNCEVLVVDSSLIKVVFETDQHEEWIYRGSMRLENMINMKGHLKNPFMNKEESKSINPQSTN